MESTDTISEPVDGERIVSRSFSAGDVILTCEPWIWVFDRAAYKDHCAHCFLKKQGLRTCSGCQLHRYCSKACQVSDWKMEHKLECAMLKTLGGSMAMMDVTTGTGRTKFYGGRAFDLIAKISNKIKLNVTMDLGDQGTLSAVDIFHSLPEQPSWPRVGAVTTDERVDDSALDLGISPSEFVDYNRIGAYNAMPLRDLREDRDRQYPFALAIYPQAPFRAMTPVCWDVNVTLNFNGRRLIIVATEDIPNCTGLHDLRHNRMMTDPFSRPLVERQDVFKMFYGYPCPCRKCTKEFDAETNPLKCITPECREPIPSDNRALAPCPRCGAVNSDQLEKFMRFTEKCEALWRDNVAEMEQTLENVRHFKEVQAETFLHPNAHIRYVYSYNRYLDYLNDGRFEEGWKLAQEMVACLKKVHPKYDVALAAKIASIGCMAVSAVKKKVLSTPLKKRKRLQPFVTAMCPVARSYCKEAEDLYISVLGADSAGADIGREWCADVDDRISSLQAAVNGDECQPFAGFVVF
ncbi:N-lysine methyltransferase SMYD2-B-like [Paramacrobiotus metropolitanus]|uniref:N-lysine methyltransferase SMYD2-B-like n=1 Tax=Paramacrobiotus metropolitanus TaxID=2943436 RepID=UPI0024458FF1|nr:N-lysine methyltransferase SMYD2-B-like [Paramacrobiotus metropolitanus]